MHSLADIEDQNRNMREEIEYIERQFAQTHGDFYKKHLEQMDQESEFDSYREKTEVEIQNLQHQVYTKEKELQQLQREI